MKRLMALLLALLMLVSAATAFAEPVTAAEDIEEIEIVSVEEAVEEEELELEPAEAEPMPEGEILPEEEIPEELPEEELIVGEEEVPEDGNEAAGAINGQPKDIIVGDGGNAVFTVITDSASPAFQWQWRPNASAVTWTNTSLNGYNKATLSFTASLGMNGRQYRCLVTDAYGTSASQAATLTVTNELTITGNPYNCIKPSGDTASFTVQAVGKGLKYQWQWRPDSSSTWVDTGLNGCKTATLSFTVSPGMSGRQYRCRVTDVNGITKASTGATLTVKGIRIATQPANASVSNGATAKFTVKAYGEGLKYQWQWRPNASTDTWSNTSLNGCNTSQLSFTASLGMNGRQYRCVVSNVDGAVYSNPATLTMSAGAVITAHPMDQSLTGGGMVHFSVTATGALKYQWQWRANASDTWKNTWLNGYSISQLSFTASVGMSGRQYRCAVTGFDGVTVYSNPATLTVKAGPATITAQPSNQAVGESTNVAFHVTAVGATKYQWQWRVNSSGTWANTGLNGYNTATLKFLATGGMNGRQYRCIVTGTDGTTVTSNAATLIVTGPAKITAQPQSVSVTEGDKATFTVTASYALAYQWQWRSGASGTWANTGLSGCNTAKLSFDTSLGMNGRQYRCAVTGTDGVTVYTSAATLTVTVKIIELSGILDLAHGARIPKLAELGFSISTYYDEGLQYYDAVLYVGDGSIRMNWNYVDGEYAFFYIEGLTTGKYTLERVDMTMTVTQARNRLLSDGWDFFDSDNYDGMTTYTYRGTSGDIEYYYHIHTYDGVHIALLEEYKTHM